MTTAKLPGPRDATQKLTWLRAQHGQLADAASAAKRVADSHRLTVENARLGLTELERRQSDFDAVMIARANDLNRFEKEHSDVNFQ